MDLKQIVQKVVLLLALTGLMLLYINRLANGDEIRIYSIQEIEVPVVVTVEPSKIETTSKFGSHRVVSLFSENCWQPKLYGVFHRRFLWRKTRYYK
jgi:hypothetical protein